MKYKSCSILVLVIEESSFANSASIPLSSRSSFTKDFGRLTKIMIDAKDFGKIATVGALSQSSGPEDVVTQAPRDYAGAQAKTDPREIRLVRRLDYRIMVRTPSTNGVFHTRLDLTNTPS